MSLAFHLGELVSAIARELRDCVRPEHPALARAWVCFGFDGKQLQVYASLNVARVSRPAAGKYRLQFAPALPDAHYCWLAFARSSSPLRLASARPRTEIKTAEVLELICTTAAGSLADSPEINLVVYR